MKFSRCFCLLLALSTRAFAAPATTSPATPIYQAKVTGPAMQTQRFSISYEATFATEKPTKGIVTLWIPFPLDDEAQAVEKYSFGAGLPPEKLLSVALKTESDYGNRFWEIKVLDPSPNEKIICEYTIVRREKSNPPSGEIRRDVKIVPPPKIYSPPQRHDGFPWPRDAAVEKQYRAIISELKSELYIPTGDPDFDFAWNLTYLLQFEGIPAKSESGFSIPLDKAEGVLAPHAWTYAFHPQRGWIPLDAFATSQNPKLADYYLGHIGSDRVAFSVGQNIKLGQRGAALPAFLSPHAEDETGASLPMKLSVNFKKLTWP